ncbi:hypothetical protein QFW77_00880 [Luteimonas sp. RD2P54]|uniref:Uncharacterized protein n=1 Tax=Luteimonas endophytica TaxID=3042023 RepID=A0ABT6J3Z9_9GAMM|nr:hypothetical protein [Luteimonas endophytica]MDH5821549.1 hypothetical protein [Luteimonas endophytica]
MSILFAFDGEDVVWTQRFDHPTVYLDTFAIRAIAESDERSARFAQNLKTRNGTWLLAAVSMGEFARFADPRHVERAERLLAQVVPHIYLFLSDPADARPSRGNTDPARRSLPPADRRNMNYFSRKWAQTQSFPETFRGMFQVVHENRDRMVEILDEVAARLVASLAHHRQMEPYRRKAKAARPDDGRTRQQIISGELLRELMLDPNASITANEAVDLMHAVDAVDYCDLVLIDKAWERRVNALHQRIADTRIAMPVARCFSMRNGGIEQFLDAIERWPTPA